GRKAYLEKADFGKGFYPEKITIPADAEIICLTYNETSSGVSMPIEDITKFREKNKEALLFVDAVSALPYPAFDYSTIDSTFFSVQKCFGLPAGLGVWIVNQRCMDKANSLLKKGKSIGTYHTLPSLLSKGKDNQTPETPNVWNIYLLSKVVKDFNEKGISTIRRETEIKAKMLYDYIGSSQNFSYAVEEPTHRSFTTIVANTKIPASEINKKLEPFDMVIGSGYSSYKETQVRISNFPAISIEQTEALIEKMKVLFN
ncbi:MAG TPA: aminotransferase class V-fold PLP-dependent enzyme, partial [Cytophagaceae bacterium]|nr:aminotransferase class V-fold PLP-dependent enzyme [Cytophagaceae bacterium]